MEEVIQRSEHLIPPQVFSKLYSIIYKYPWLIYKSHELAELWNLCDSSNKQKLLEDMLDTFRLVNSSELEQLGNQIACQVNDQWGLKSDVTLLVATSDSVDADGSQAFLQMLKNKFENGEGWGENNFINSIRDGVLSTDIYKNIILFDDFIGTGDTISRRTKWFKDELGKINIIDVNIYIISLAAMNQSIPKLEKLGVPYYSPIWLDRGISDKYTSDILSDMVNSMIELEKKLKKKVNNHRLPNFGYKNRNQRGQSHLIPDFKPKGSEPIDPTCKSSGSDPLFFCTR